MEYPRFWQKLKSLTGYDCSFKVFSGKGNTRYQEIIVLDSRLRGNDEGSTFLEIF